MRREDSGPSFIPPRWATSIEGLIAARARVRAACRRVARRRYGPAYSLWNREARCWTPACPGRIHFLASAGDGTPFIRLRDRRRKKG